MRVLLTGATGFVGQHIHAQLMKNTRWNITRTNYDLRGGVVASHQFDYIIHLASKSSVEESIKKPEQFIRNNISSMIKVLEFARKNPPKVFLHFSTVEVYNVTNPYAASKAAQEELANAYWKTYGVPVVIARSSNIIGAGQGHDKFVPKIIDSIKNGKKLDIYTSGGRVGSRVYNPIENITSAVLFLLKLYPTLQNFDPDFPVHFDIGGGQKMTNLQMATKIAELLDRPLNYTLVEPQQARPTYPRTLVASGAKLEEYGWTPPVTLEEGMAWIK